MMLRAAGLRVRLRGKVVLDDVDFAPPSGAVTGVIGPNGVGKTTLLRTLAAVIPADAGTLSMADRPLADYAPVERARTLAFLPQGRTIHWRLTVRSIVAMGRIPFRGIGRALTAVDIAAVDAAMQAMEVRALAERDATELSGGELARVMLARALAQTPRILLADEPVAGLDPAHQLRLMAHFKAMAASGIGVVLSLHDLSLAARFCDHLALLYQGRMYACGTPEVVLTTETLREVFAIEAHIGKIASVPTVVPLSLPPEGSC